MKAAILYIAIFALCLLCIPMIALNFDTHSTQQMQADVHTPAVTPSIQVSGSSTQEKPKAELADQEEPEIPEPEAVEEPLANIPLSEYGIDSFRIMDESTGVVSEISLQDYVRGAVASEMPALFHVEALKAQAVAAHTYALHNYLVQLKAPDPELNGADFSADPSNFKGYITKEQARSFYGEQADLYWDKICEAADSVMNYILEYDDQPIVAAYHAISAGQTEDASNVWSGSAPYLMPVDSPGDLLSPEYESTVVIPFENMRNLLTEKSPNIKLASNPTEWFGDTVRSGSGYVLEITIGDQLFTGKDVREMLDLRSHNFEVLPVESGFEFTVFGYGHGVGLSQYGADYLARQGYDFKEILETYYSDTTLKQISPDILD